MNLKRRGKCVIFNHTTFSGKEERAGSNFDEVAIKETFSDLGFEPIVHSNLSFIEITDEIFKCM